MIFYFLLVIHILCGSISLACSIAAIATPKGSQIHKKYGRYFFYGMTGIFITALPMASIKSNMFLFLIAIFSYYLAYSGFRYARRREPVIPISDWIICSAMMSASIIMIIMGLWSLNSDRVQSTVLLIFGFLGGNFSFGDALMYYKGQVPYKLRITRHLGAMLGGTIAVFTAFLVTNITIEHSIYLWLGPTVLFTPIIIYWTNRVQKNKGLLNSQ